MAAAFSDLNRIDGVVERGNWLARLRIRLIYAWRHYRLPLDRPRRFAERVQWRKLSERSRHLASLTDKVTAKTLVADRLGVEWVVLTL